MQWDNPYVFCVEHDLVMSVSLRTFVALAIIEVSLVEDYNCTTQLHTESQQRFFWRHPLSPQIDHNLYGM